MTAPNSMNKAQYRAWSRPLVDYLEGNARGNQEHEYAVAAADELVSETDIADLVTQTDLEDAIDALREELTPPEE